MIVDDGMFLDNINELFGDLSKHYFIIRTREIELSELVSSQESLYSASAGL